MDAQQSDPEGDRKQADNFGAEGISAKPEATEIKAAEPTHAHEHIWGEGKVTRKKSLTLEGKITYACTVCGETKVERVAV